MLIIHKLYIDICKSWKNKKYCVQKDSKELDFSIVLDFNKIPEEKTKYEQHKDVMCCLEEILEATPHKTTAIQPLISYLTNIPSKRNSNTWTH